MARIERPVGTLPSDYYVIVRPLIHIKRMSTDDEQEIGL
jgi:hypothetical protein